MKRTIMILLGLMICIGLTGFGSADIEYYPLNKQTNLILTCKINGAIPSASATMNLTISYPNGTPMIDNQLATPMGNGIFNYTTTFPINGIYKPVLVCVDGVLSYSDDSGFYEINTNGYELRTSNSIVYTLLLIVGIFIFILLLYGSIAIPWKNPQNEEGQVIGVNELKYLKLVMIVFAYLVFLFLMGMITSISKNFLLFDNGSRLFEMIYWILLRLLWPLIVVVLVIWFIQWATGKKLAKQLKRGLPCR